MQVTRIYLDYSADSEFASDPRFLASAKFFGLSTLPNSVGNRIELGVGGSRSGDSPPLVPQSWVPTPSVALRSIALQNATSIDNQNLCPTNPWAYSSTIDINGLLTNSISYTKVFQDILSAVNLQGFTNVYILSNGSKADVPCLLVGLGNGQNLSNSPTSWIPPNASNVFKDPASNRTSSNKIPNLVGLADVCLKLQFVDATSYGNFMSALADIAQGNFANAGGTNQGVFEVS